MNTCVIFATIKVTKAQCQHVKLIANFYPTCAHYDDKDKWCRVSQSHKDNVIALAKL